MTKCLTTHKSIEDWTGSLRTQLIAFRLSISSWAQCPWSCLSCLFWLVFGFSCPTVVLALMSSAHRGRTGYIIIPSLPYVASQPYFLTTSSKAPSTAAKKKRSYFNPGLARGILPLPEYPLPFPLSLSLPDELLLSLNVGPSVDPFLVFLARVSLLPTTGLHSPALEEPAFGCCHASCKRVNPSRFGFGFPGPSLDSYSW